MKKIIEKFYELGGVLFIFLMFIGILLYFFGYFDRLKIFWIIVFIIIAWLIYIYRYLEEKNFKDDS